jgi:GntR family transcriptional regulator, transcriptional repressor for pyruvate dehydrogenase complex
MMIKASDLVIKKLIDSIVKGEIKPGDKLPSTENIAREFGTSVISAREAVQNLAIIGLVEISHGRGIFLTRGTPVIEELFEARRVIESHNAMMAARNIDAKGLEHMSRLLDEMDRCLEKGDTDTYTDRDFEFHLSIGKASGNRILLKTLENIKALLRYQQFMINRIPDIIRRSSVKHKEIYSAIKRRDAESARAVMARHIADVIRSWKKNTVILQGQKQKGSTSRTAAKGATKELTTKGAQINATRKRGKK